MAPIPSVSRPARDTPPPRRTEPARSTSTSQTVSSGNTTNVTLTISTGSIQVTVKNQSGTALTGAAPGTALTLTGPNSFSATGTTGAAAPTPSRTSRSEQAATRSPPLSAPEPVRPAGITVSVTSPATPAVVTIQTGSIAVTVKDQNGVALTAAALTLTGPGGYSATGSTGAGNTYTFPNVPVGAGGYSLAAVVSAGTGTAAGIIVSSTTPAIPALVHGPDRLDRRHRQGPERERPHRGEPHPDRPGRLLRDRVDGSRKHVHVHERPDRRRHIFGRRHGRRG